MRIVEIQAIGVITKQNVASVMEALVYATQNFIKRDVYILVSENTKALCDIAYMKSEICHFMHRVIRIKIDLADECAEVIEIDLDFKIKTITKIAEI